MYCPCGNIYKPWLEKQDILCIIEEDLEYYKLCHMNKFEKAFFNNLQQKATSSNIIHYGLMQHILILYPDYIKFSKKKKQVSPFMNIEFDDTNFKTFCILR